MWWKNPTSPTLCAIILNIGGFSIYVGHPVISSGNVVIMMSTLYPFMHIYLHCAVCITKCYSFASTYKKVTTECMICKFIKTYL